ncbi:hypothetical protein QK105_002619 [Yersinia enterocolitica]|nr:hypothetical protein [Yersinia enterocolitica]EKN5989885.1 hypothetical protein [Yersinia enterocolitica]ELX2242196.1 hypothetical protein [Yersinia enterocolitica]
MKELDSFTVERLEEIIAEEGYSAMRTPKNDEVRALARIALAAKRAEPIYQYQSGVCMFDDIEWVWDDCDKGFYVQYDPTRRRIVYTTPQLNSPEIPDGWKLVPIEPTLAMLTLLGLTGSFESMLERYANMLDAAPERENG